MYRLLLAGILITGCTLACGQTAAQSTPTVDQLYGQGVHAYHDGELNAALERFNKAVEAGTQDPRILYFRGLVHGEMGDLTAADKDFQTGAEIEMGPTGRHYAVGQALERVQGKMRLRIEKARHNAKAAQVAEQAQLMENAIAEIPFIPEKATTAEDANKTMNFPDVAGVRNPGTPFQQPLEVNTKKPIPRAAVAAEPAEPKTEAAPTQEDPFGDRSADPAEMKSEDDPFADSKADPFAEDNKQEKADDKKKEDDDPFGGGI